MEKLHELHDEGGFDLIVVDTPPTRHALDFLDAPQRLTAPARQPHLPAADDADARVPARSRASRCRRSCARSRASSAPRSIDDVVAFFRAFEGMEAGFRDARARGRGAARRPDDRVRARDLAAPRRDGRGAVLRASSSASTASTVDALIVNRVHPRSATRRPTGCVPRAASAASSRTPTPARAAGSPRSTTTSPTSARSPSSSASTSRACTTRIGVGDDRVRAVPRPRRLRLRRAARGRQAPVRRSDGDELAAATDDHDPRRRRREVGARPGARRRSSGPASRSSRSTRGQDVRDTVAEIEPDLVVLDLQIGNMGGVAVAIDLRLEESGGRLAARDDPAAARPRRRRVHRAPRRRRPHAREAGRRRRAAPRRAAAARSRGCRARRRRAGDRLSGRPRSSRPTSRAKPASSSSSSRRAAATKDEGDRLSNDLILAAPRERATRRRGALRGVEGRPGPPRTRSACGSSTRSTARASSAKPAAPTGPCTSRSSSTACPTRRRGRASRARTSVLVDRDAAARARAARPTARSGCSCRAPGRRRSPSTSPSVLDAELVPLGSAGAKAMAVVLGDADVYAHSGGQYEWDSAAPVGVATAAGCHCSRLDGSPLVYNQPDPYLPDLLVCRAELAATRARRGRAPRPNSAEARAGPIATLPSAPRGVAQLG